ncbi:tRNA threonylcarbamoyladenosine dehydratase [Variovorax dokdonensis]|uniref:tRNA threonylcarbamoyladenosine dehydratase n=1 Tax=Variovorax dokdonensis TaxID=344883 RepID=A0ABT7N8W0_9BURK|nr:tRNA threonylcarbamoyladenosine dehydratase [Variovorax dokdonensis]MDM0044387.1 tRNA threonylcarbamoyladenosine dehydratase [Variovorax dokdonensis]
MTAQAKQPDAASLQQAALSLAPDLERRFSGLDRLYGVQGAAQVRAAHVLIVGIGGVGSWTAEALARSGVGRLTLIDLDHVSESNINRQIHALDSTVGQAKVLAMRERISQINPACSVLAIDDFVEPGNWLELLAKAQANQGHVSAVIDCCDQVKAKLALAQWSREQKTADSANRSEFVTVGAAGGKRLAHKVDIEDLSQVTHDPLLAQVRQRLRKQFDAPREGKKMGVDCVFSREAVAPPDASCAVDAGGDGTLNCHGYGSVVAVTATFGQCAAGWVIDRIARASTL